MPLTDQLLQVVIFEENDQFLLPPDDRYRAVASLLEQGHCVKITRQTDGPKPTSPTVFDTNPRVILGRSAKRAYPHPPHANTRIEELSGPISSETLLSRVTTLRQEMAALAPAAWKPWFPVIDYERCTNCMQCLSFCLFGVYGVDEERRLRVQNQDSCKTNCPACSRVCPEAAIIFPKYKAGPINGDVVSHADVNREKMKIDISALLGGDVYDLLRTRSERSRSRFSKERDSDKALAERQKCLNQLASEIPPEVLMSLPSVEEIARKAEQAAARARAALSPRTDPE